MIEFDIKRSQRRCCVTDESFQPGDTYYSALVEQSDEFVRQDFCADAWKGPPENCVGWWKCQIPASHPNRVYWAPNDVLIAYFQQLIDRPDKADTLYVMALLLIRKRLLRIESIETDNDGNEIMQLSSAKLGKIRIPQRSPTERQVSEIQNELCEQLFVDAPTAGDTQVADDTPTPDSG